MKKHVLIAVSVLLPFFIFAKDDATTYWEKEIDMDGQLVTYYLVKTDEQLSYNLEYFIKELTGIESDTFMPNTSLIKKQMVSEEYLKSKHPKIYTHFMENDSSEESKIDWEEYKYCFTGLSYSDELGLVCLLKRNNDKKYFSMAMYMYGGLNWAYTTQILDLIESTLDEN